ncbi:HAMP domain-containing histidine kinase [bacterium]|nr:HAMP domain-containing histidine kinase [bacterium]
MSSTETHFASPQTKSESELEMQRERLMALPHLSHLLEAFPTPAVILNDTRQIVLHNNAFAAAMPSGDYDLLLGLRVGQAIGCSYEKDTPSGCGTGKHCRMCGAVLAMLEAGKGTRSVQECRISVEDHLGGGALDFRVLGVPIDVNGEELTILSLVDISDEKRRRVLERIFFHDLLNTASGLQNLTDLLRIVPSEERDELLEDLQGVSGQLINEIETQRDLLAAEGEELRVVPRRTTTDDMVSHVHALYRFHHLAQDRHFKTINKAAGVEFTTDPTLLARAVGNLVKNAFEASQRGQTVTITCEREDEDTLCFLVHNETVMSETVRLHMFERSFSTKGPGRGIGTYSARLLIERFLGGSIMFTSMEETGTCFTVRIPREYNPAETATNDEERDEIGNRNSGGTA